MITRTLEVTDLTPSELAELFTDMDGDKQAQFFAAIAPIARTWPGAGWCHQAYSIAQALDRDGREVIIKLAEHVLDCDNLEAAAMGRVL